jgi:hypothetical protein
LTLVIQFHLDALNTCTASYSLGLARKEREEVVAVKEVLTEHTLVAKNASYC